MATGLNFEDNDTKKLLSKLDIDFFLKQNFEAEKYSESDIGLLYLSYEDTLKKLKVTEKKNKKQFFLFTEGKVRKMFIGGFLPNLFELDGDIRKFSILSNRFQDVGHDLAYFNYWQKHQRRKITNDKIWDYTIKVGSIAGILLTIWKLLEVFGIVCIN
jgi:hypothetical protein